MTFESKLDGALDLFDLEDQMLDSSTIKETKNVKKI